LTKKRVVDYATAKALADNLGITYCETSAKTGSGVDSCFNSIVSLIMKKKGGSTTAAGNEAAIQKKPAFIQNLNNWRFKGLCTII
jgi:Ras-related protein Rab-1A